MKHSIQIQVSQLVFDWSLQISLCLTLSSSFAMHPNGNVAHVLFMTEHRKHIKCLNWDILSFHHKNQLIFEGSDTSQKSWDRGNKRMDK